MVVMLIKQFGLQGLADILGVTSMAVNHWRAGSCGFSDSSRKLIFLLWCIAFEPSRCATWFDWITWGRFAGDDTTHPTGAREVNPARSKLARSRRRTKKGNFPAKRVKYQQFDPGI